MSEQLPSVGIDLAQTKVDVVIWREPNTPARSPYAPPAQPGGWLDETF